MSPVLGTLTVAVDVARGLREGAVMFWQTLWALILGFTLSGAVQAFVSKERMRTALGDHRPASVARASGFGMVSSSCSYAASAMARSLIDKGSDFTSAVVFQVASTNLVVELGVVLLALLGWQFAAAEFVGGPIMIVLLALAGGAVFTPALVAGARRHRDSGHDRRTSGIGGRRQDELDVEPLRVKLRSPAAWSDASGYAVADATMLRRELLIGYSVAGLIAVLVPARAWDAVFLHGHGFWTSLENALVGPLIAVASWVCSIGNVPLAAALWSGGISFGGVVAFLFADLIAMPLILVYRKFYGWRLTVRLVGLLYAVMVVAGLTTQGIFRAFGAVPDDRTVGHLTQRISWGWTTWLDLVSLGVAAAVWWAARNRDRFGGGAGYAVDPVCGMQVRTADAPARAVHDGVTVYFCADRCRQRFESDRARYDRAPLPGRGGGVEPAVAVTACAPRGAVPSGDGAPDT